MINIFFSIKRYEHLQLPNECVIKVFKTTLTDFKTREKYIRDDYRFKDRLSKGNTRTVKFYFYKNIKVYYIYFETSMCNAKLDIILEQYLYFNIFYIL